LPLAAAAGAGLPVSQWMAAWTYTPNYPVIQVPRRTPPHRPTATPPLAAGPT
jgi:hypothetical protein